jgi:exopolysaccharide production protein ExoQ
MDCNPWQGGILTGQRRVEENMLKKGFFVAAETIAYLLFFFLTIRRIVGDGLLSLEEQAFDKTIHEMVLWFLLILVFSYFAFKQSVIQQFFLLWKRNWILLPFLIFALCSIAWSTNVVATIYKGIVLLGCTTIAAYTGLAHRYTFIFRELKWFLFCLAIVTFIFALADPLAGTHVGYPYYGAWRGIFWSKNYMGPMMAFGNLVAVFNIAESRKKLLPFLGNILFYVLTALLVFLSKCATAIILFVVLNLGFLLVVAWVKLKSRLKKIHYITLVLVCIVILVIGSLNLNFLFGLLNRNATLTGRLPFWSFLLDTGLNNAPIIGNGLGATWESNNFRFTSMSDIKWDLPPLVSDNGYMDIFLHLGLIGVSLLIIAVLFCLFRAVRYAIKFQSIGSFFPILSMIIIIIVNFSLSFFLELESFAWFLMVFGLFSTTPLPTRLNAMDEIQKSPA